MKPAVWGILFGVMIVLGMAGLADPTRRVHATPSTATLGVDGSRVTVVASDNDNRQQVVLIDPDMRVIAVYHVGHESGKISLKSVRNFKWDLEMMQWNSQPPQPQEVRSMLQQDP